MRAGELGANRSAAKLEGFNLGRLRCSWKRSADSSHLLAGVAGSALLCALFCWSARPSRTTPTCSAGRTPTGRPGRANTLISAEVLYAPGKSPTSSAELRAPNFESQAKSEKSSPLTWPKQDKQQLNYARRESWRPQKLQRHPDVRRGHSSCATWPTLQVQPGMQRA